MRLLRTLVEGNRKLFWTFAVATLVLDQVTKLLLWHHPAEGRPNIVLIPHLLRIVSHPGNVRGVLGLGPASVLFYIVMAAVALAVVGVLFLTAESHKVIVHAALGLVTGAAVGNLVDRIAFGRVRDFIDLHWGEALHWHTFNVADAAICVGFALIIYDAFAGKGRRGKAPDSGPGPPQTP